METPKVCKVCWYDNHHDNFTCENCGFDFDLKIVYNEHGLPEIEW